MRAARTAVVLGSTGSIGTAQVDRFASDPEIQVVAIAAAGGNIDLIAYQAVELGVFGIALKSGSREEVHAALDEVNQRAGTNVRPEVLIGPETAHLAASAGVDLVVNAIEGVEGVAPSIGALKSGAHLAVANTETLLSKDLLTQELGESGRLPGSLTLLNPALAGIQEALAQHRVSRIILTTRGSQPRPSRRRSTPYRVNAQTGAAAGQAMLELGSITEVEVEVVEHDGPIASIVELSDGRILMNRRPHSGSSWERRVSWKFEPVKLAGIRLAKEAAREGGTYPAVLHAANVASVQAHLDGLLALERINDVVASVMHAHTPPSEPSVADLTRVNTWAKDHAREVILSGH